MKNTGKKAIYGIKKFNVAPIVRSVFLNDDGEEVIVVNGHQYKIAELEENEEVFLVVGQV